jgi:hypothetical protein
VWKPVVALNLVAITVFLWHMTAYLIVLWIYERLGHTLRRSRPPTGGRNAGSGCWPLVALVMLIAVFARVEIIVRRPRRKADQGR